MPLFGIEESASPDEDVAARLGRNRSRSAGATPIPRFLQAGQLENPPIWSCLALDAPTTNRGAYRASRIPLPL